MSLPDKAFPVSWDQFHRDARALAWRLAGLKQDFRAIVCITRGGLVPAAIISRELNIRLIETVCIASYHDYLNQGEVHVLKGITAALSDNGGEGVLVVDDLTDTGKTALEVRALLPKAHFAAVYAKPKGVPTIDTSSPRCRRTHGSTSPGTWGSPIRNRSPRTTAAEAPNPAISRGYQSFRLLSATSLSFARTGE